MRRVAAGNWLVDGRTACYCSGRPRFALDRITATSAGATAVSVRRPAASVGAAGTPQGRRRRCRTGARVEVLAAAALERTLALLPEEVVPRQSGDPCLEAGHEVLPQLLVPQGCLRCLRGQPAQGCGPQLEAAVDLEEVPAESQVAPRRAPVGGQPELELGHAVAELDHEVATERLGDRVGQRRGRGDNVSHDRGEGPVRHDGCGCFEVCARGPGPKCRVGGDQTLEVAVLARDVEGRPWAVEYGYTADGDDLAGGERRQVVLDAVTDVRAHDPRSSDMGERCRLVQHVELEHGGR